VSCYELDAHHERILTLAAGAWDRCEQAREALSEHGLVFSDRHGAVKARPEIAVERDSRIAFARLIREIDLDGEPAADPRPPRRS
jgi:phage terminase small subunit